MVEVQSNNPYRRSMSLQSPQPPQPPPPAAGQQQHQLSAYGPTSPADGRGSPTPTPHSPHSPPPLVKFPSTTTTIAEEPEPESDQHPGLVRTPTPTVTVKACDDKDKDSSDVVITIHPTISSGTVQQPEYCPMPIRTNTHPHPRKSIGEPCPVWPARRFMQKQVMAKKTKWVIIKVILALIFIVGAVAIGFGISKAARGGR